MLGIALEAQQGVHSLGSDRRTDFCSRFGELSFKPGEMDVFSEPPRGGEYLVVRLGAAAVGPAPGRPQWLATCCTLAVAHWMRAALLGGAGAAQIEGLAQSFVQYALGDWIGAALAPRPTRTRYAGVLAEVETALEEERADDLRLDALA